MKKTFWRLGIAGLLVAGAQQALAEDRDYLLEYGQYLAGECTGCHKLGGETEGSIPILEYIDEEYFVEALVEYKDGTRDNEAMRNVALNLDDEMMRALAIYFASLTPEEEEEVEEETADEAPAAETEG